MHREIPGKNSPPSLRARFRQALRLDDQHRTGSLADDPFGDAAQEQPAEAGAAVAADHDQVGAALPGQRNNGCSGIGIVEDDAVDLESA